MTISPQQRTLTRLTALLDGKLCAADRSRVHSASLEAVFATLQTLMARSDSTTSRGYRVKVGYRAVPKPDREARLGVVNQVIARSLKRLGK